MSMEYNFTVPGNALLPITGNGYESGYTYMGFYIDQHYDIVFDVETTEVGASTGPTAYLYDKNTVKIEPSLEYFFGLRILPLFNIGIDNGMYGYLQSGNNFNEYVLKPGTNKKNNINSTISILYADAVQKDTLYKYNAELSKTNTISDAFEKKEIMNHFISKPDNLDIPEGNSSYDSQESVQSENITGGPWKAYFGRTYIAYPIAAGLSAPYADLTVTDVDNHRFKGEVTFTFVMDSLGGYTGIKMPELYQVYAYYSAGFQYPAGASSIVFMVEPMIYTHDEKGNIVPVE